MRGSRSVEKGKAAIYITRRWQLRHFEAVVMSIGLITEGVALIPRQWTDPP